MSFGLSLNKTIREEVRKGLAIAAISYLETGMTIFNELQKKPYIPYKEGKTQAAIGNLSISIELMIKSIIAREAFVFLYKGLPEDLFKSLSTSTEGIRELRKYAVGLQSSTYKTIEFNEAVGKFYNIFPEMKREFKPYLSLVASKRNNSVHAYIPKYHHYELERIAYIALRVFLFLNKSNLFKFMYVKIDCGFVEKYQDERVKRVDTEILKAKEASKKIEHRGSSTSIESWDFFVHSCPICDSDGIFEGYTDLDVYEANGTREYSLYFFAQSFECTDCGLHLVDERELELVGLETHHERDYELDQWFEENGK